MRMIYYSLAGIAAFGFVAGVTLHSLTWFETTPDATTMWPWSLHLIALFLGLQLAILANLSKPKDNRRNLNHLLDVIPQWATNVALALFAYAFWNMAFFAWSIKSFPKNQAPPYLVLRGFSGHWMLFYFLETIGFLAMGRLARKNSFALADNESSHEDNNGAIPNGTP